MSLFYFVAFFSILFSLMVVFTRNPVYSVLYLIATFFTFTIHYILLNAQFLAVVNFIVYMGAIMVLFLFVLMLMNLNKETEPMKSNLIKVIGVIAGGAFLVTIVGATKAWQTSQVSALPNSDIGLVENLGKVLFNEYLLPFELASILLLSALVGAVLLAKKDKRTQNG